MKDCPKACGDCHKPLRTRRQSAVDYPGTVRHDGWGYCTTCYRRRQRSQTLPTAEPIEPVTACRPCTRCGLLRVVRTERAGNEWCASCKDVAKAPDLPYDDDEWPEDIGHGRWTFDRGIRVWRQDVPA